MSTIKGRERMAVLSILLGYVVIRGVSIQAPFIEIILGASLGLGVFFLWQWLGS